MAESGDNNKKQKKNTKKNTEQNGLNVLARNSFMCRKKTKRRSERVVRNSQPCGPAAQGGFREKKDSAF